MIYTTECQLISQFKKVQIYKILCDRGICQSGITYFIGKD